MVSWPRLMVEATCTSILGGGLEGTEIPLWTVATTPLYLPFAGGQYQYM